MSEFSSVPECTIKWARQRQIPLHAEVLTGSTNDNAKSSAMGEEDPLVLYVASHQTSGRGRGTNEWLDTGAGESLLSTWSFAVTAPPQAISGPRVGLSLFTGARRIWPSLAWSLKVPNDIYLGGKKMGGLLLESVSSGNHHRLLIGLGLNITNHPRRFANATHLSEILGQVPEESEWFRFLDELKTQFELAVTDCASSFLTESVRQELAHALDVTEVSAQGDLISASGRVRWSDL